MQHRGSERPHGSGAPQHATLNSGAAQSAALKSGSARPAAVRKRNSDHEDPMPDAKRNGIGDTFQVAQNAASASGPSQLGDDQSLEFDVWKLLEPLPGTKKAAEPRRHDNGDGLQSQAVQMAHGVAGAIEQDLRAYWASRAEEGALVQREPKQLRLLLTCKTKLPVHKDLWIPGAAPPGEQQYVETMITDCVVLHHATAHLAEQAPGDGPAQPSGALIDCL